MSDITSYFKTGLVGGTVNDLDSIDGVDLLDKDFAFVMAANKFYTYLLDIDSGLAEATPDIIAPDTNAGDKRWILQPWLSGTVTRDGLLKLATAAMAIAGTDTATAVTPEGLTSRLAAPGAIGGTTPGAGAFAALSATGAFDLLGSNITYVPIGANIQTYINSAASGDTLILASGEYIITADLTIDKALNIVGQGNAGFYSIPSAAGHGTVISSVTASITAFNITASNVRIAHLSINLTGAGSTAVGTANNLTGIVLTNIDAIVTCTGLAQGFMLCGSNAVFRNLTFYITSTNGAATGLYFYNTAATTQDAICDCFSVTGITKGNNAGSDNWCFLAENQNDANTLTLNLSVSVCKALAGTGMDIAVASVSFGSGTNSSIVNAYFCTLEGHDYDVYQDGTNQLNVGGSVLVNNLVFGTVTYRAALAAGIGAFTTITGEFHGTAVTVDHGGTGKASVTLNSYLKGNGTGALIERTYAEVLTDLGLSDGMTYKGAIDCSGNPNYPAANAGDFYRISVAGKIGGASGIVVEVGDSAICNLDSSASGDQATVGANWNVFQVNIDWASPPALGATTPNTGKFSTLTLTTDLAIAEGGTGQSTAQAAIDALTAVSAATPEYVLTKDTGSGNAIWKVATGGGGVSVADIGSTAETVGGAVDHGTAATASRSDHKHAITNPKLDTLATPDNNTALNADTTNHGLLLKATAPGAGLMNFVGITFGETLYSLKPLFSTATPEALGTASPGTAVIASRVDHVHALPSIPVKASAAEINTGTDDAKFATADGLAGSNMGMRVLTCLVFDGTTALATGDGKCYQRIPAPLNGHNIVAVAATLIAAKSTSGTPTVQIARGRQAAATTIHAFSDVLSTLLTIDPNEWDSKNATIAAAISAATDDLATGDLLRIDVDLAGTGAQGLIVQITTQLP